MIDLLLIDGNNWLHRIHHATYQHGERVAEPSMLLQKQYQAIRKSLVAKSIVIAFDGEGENWRKALWPQYKSQRPDKAESVRKWLLEGETWLRAISDVECIKVAGAEADDVIATVAREAQRRLTTQGGRALATKTVIVSGDKDLFQLLSAEQVTILRSFKTHLGKVVGCDWMNHERFERKYTIAPPQWPHWRAIVGDTSDGMGGVPAVGETAATALLQRYMTVEEIVIAIRKFKMTGIPKSKEQSILKEWDNGNLEKWVRIHTLLRNVPMPASRSAVSA